MKHRKTNRKTHPKNKKREASLSKHLAGAAAVTLLGAGAAQGAMIYDEQQQQPGGDFADSFVGRASISITEYDTVKGEISGGGDSDFFTWTGFSPNQSVTLTVDVDSPPGISMFPLNESGGSNGSAHRLSQGTQRIEFQATSVGNLNFRLTEEFSTGINYQITVPEPGTGAAVGALGALAALRRGRRRGRAEAAE